MVSIIGETTRKHDIIFHRSGRIDILSRVSKALDIQGADLIDIAVEDGEYYLYVRGKAKDSFGRHEGRCFSTKKTSKSSSRHLRAHSKKLTNAIMSKFPNLNRVRISAGSVIDNAPSIGKAIILIVNRSL